MMRQLAPLGVPTPMPTAADGVIPLIVTWSPPICCTANVCEFEPSTSSWPVNVSVIVGAAGVGVTGADGSAQPTVHKVIPSTTARNRFIVFNDTRSLHCDDDAGEVHQR